MSTTLGNYSRFKWSNVIKCFGAKNVYHVKFTEKCLIWTKKYSLVYYIFKNKVDLSWLL